jgi:predicted TIM-barrel fold metal-dependent hydrolase
MIDGNFVIDSIVHAFDSRTENAITRFGKAIFLSAQRFQYNFTSPEYRIEPRRYFQRMSADVLDSALFAESQVDMAVFHTVPIWGFIADFSPAEIGIELRRRHPDRVRLYGGISPLQGQAALDELDRQVEEWGIIGLKLYPMDVIDGEVRVLSFEDSAITYPVLERCRKLGVKVIAIHKAFPLGPVQLDPFRVDDVDYAARDFPDLAFEVVHSGMAFLEESAMQVARFDNVYVNLETTASLAELHPRRLATVLGELIAAGGGKRLLWSSALTNSHPRAVLEAFVKLEMPADLIDGHGYPPLTAEIKADVLGLNYARLHGIDVEAVKWATANDAVSRRRAEGLSPPWSQLQMPEVIDPMALEVEATPA